MTRRHYDALREFLIRKVGDEVPLKFSELESVLGFKLPRSACQHRAWWANDERGHSHARAWLGAGYRSEQVDMAARRVVFRRVAAGGAVVPGQRGTGVPNDSQRTARGWFPGRKLLWADPEYDFTQPPVPELADLLDEKYGRGDRR